jgi:hypothetical protein
VEFDDEEGFRITQMPPSIIPPNSAVQFEVAFAPKKAGACETVMMIYNNDLGEDDPYNVTISGEAVTGACEVFPVEGELPDGWTQPAGADAGWHVQYQGHDTIWTYFGEGGVNTFAAEGVAFLESDPIKSKQTAAIEYSGEFEKGDVVFDYKTSSNAPKKEGDRRRGDFLVFYIDDEAQEAWTGGQYNWRTATFPIEKGTHTLKWVYEKNASRSGNQDRVWIDNVKLPLRN